MLKPRPLAIAICAVLLVLGLAAAVSMVPPTPQPAPTRFYETGLPGMFYVPTTAGGRPNYAAGLEELFEQHPNDVCTYWGSVTSQTQTDGYYVRCVPKEEPPDCNGAVHAQELTPE